MNVLKIRSEIRNGKTIFDPPLRVTFYARVSTDKDGQLNSLENQVQYYTQFIREKPSWTYVQGYVDEGISGTSTKKRNSFKQMIKNAKAGRFDFIITKEIYKRRSRQMMAHQNAADFHNRYPYSGKLICEEHRSAFYRHVVKRTKGETESWQCRIYRNRGRAGCSAPHLRTVELDQIMASLFDQLIQDRQAVIDSLVDIIQSVPDEYDYLQDIRRVEGERSSIHAKKNRLLEMSIDGVISTSEFKSRNNGFNEQVEALEKRLAIIRAEAEKGHITIEQMNKIRSALAQELYFQNGINSAIATAILDHIVVKKAPKGNMPGYPFERRRLLWGCVQQRKFVLPVQPFKNGLSKRAAVWHPANRILLG